MIMDSLENSAVYETINPLFKQAFDYIKSLDLEMEPTGKRELKGDDLVVMVNQTVLKPCDETKMEVHNAYIDIHVPISAIERFSWKHRSRLKTASYEFDVENDAQHFEDEPEAYFDVCPGDFVIFFPNDAHSGCIGEGDIKKVIVKVRVSA